MGKGFFIAASNKVTSAHKVEKKGKRKREILGAGARKR